MSELIPGLIVERMIPPDVWGGLMTGKYDLSGGVTDTDVFPHPV